MPFRASMLAFLVLQLAVLDDHREELVGERNGAAACAGLDLNFYWAAVAALWERACMTDAICRAWWRACSLMPLYSLRAWSRLVVAGTASVGDGQRPEASARPMATCCSPISNTATASGEDPERYGVIAIATGLNPTLIGLRALFVAVRIGVTVLEPLLTAYAVLPSGVISMAWVPSGSGSPFPRRCRRRRRSSRPG